MNDGRVGGSGEGLRKVFSRLSGEKYVLTGFNRHKNVIE